MTAKTQTEYPVVDLFIVSTSDPRYIEAYLLGPDAKRNEQSIRVISWN